MTAGVPELRTRKPTGQVAYPFVLVEGDEKAGKSYVTYRLSASPRVGRMFVLDLGEGTGDEYAALGPYELLLHDGTFRSILGQVKAAAAVPQHEGRPNVIAIDDGTWLWDMLKDWAAYRARSSKKGREALQRDPDAELDIPMNLWNDAKDRWNEVINVLRGFPGIGVMIARGREVSKVQGGVPVAGQTEWRVDAEKNVGFAASAWVRMTRPHTATLIGVRSLSVDVPARGLVLEGDNPLEHLVFGVLGAGGGFVPSSRVMPLVGLERPQAKQRLLELVRDAGAPAAAATAIASELWATTGDPAEVTAEAWGILMEVASIRLPGMVDAAQREDAESLTRPPAPNTPEPPPNTDPTDPAELAELQNRRASVVARIEALPTKQKAELVARWDENDRMHPYRPDNAPPGVLRLVEAMVDGFERSARKDAEGEAEAEAGPASADHHAAEVIAGATNGDDAVLAEIVADVAKMPLSEVQERLHGYRLPKGGSADVRRQRLVAKMLELSKGGPVIKDVPA